MSSPRDKGREGKGSTSEGSSNFDGGKARRKQTFKQSCRKSNSGEDDVIDVVPLRFKRPRDDIIREMDPKLIIEDLKTGWIEEERCRQNGHIDKYYHHLKSKEECRSLLEVYDFIRLGVPEQLREELINEGKAPKTKEKRSGTSLLRKRIVGTYNCITKKVSPHDDGGCQNVASASGHNEAEEAQGDQHVYPYIAFEFV